jgi:hypothetical protein
MSIHYYYYYYLFTTKENQNMAYGFTYLNKYFE